MRAWKHLLYETLMYVLKLNAYFLHGVILYCMCCVSMYIRIKFCPKPDLSQLIHRKNTVRGLNTYIVSFLFSYVKAKKFSSNKS
jgi:hypothetical protein